MMEQFLHEWATYWAPGKRDLFGGNEWEPPVMLRGRWQQTTKRIVSKTGQDIVTRGYVVLEREVNPEGRLARGWHNVPDPLSVESFEPQAMQALTMLDGTQTGVKVWM